MADGKTDFLEGLQSLSGRGARWDQIGRILQDRFAGDSNWGRRRDVWESAATATGLASVMLRRYLVVLNKIDQIAEESGLPPPEILSKSFSAIEIATRLYERDHKAGLRALRELNQGRLTLDALRKRLETSSGEAAQPAAHARSLSLRERGVLLENCETALAAAVSKIFGQESSIRRRRPLRFFVRTGYEIDSGAGKILGGLDLFMAGASGRDPLEKLAQSVELSRYFPAFWIALAPSFDDAGIRDAASALSAFAADWIGVLAIDGSGESSIVRSPCATGPRPDMSSHLEALRNALSPEADLAE